MFPQKKNISPPLKTAIPDLKLYKLKKQTNKKPPVSVVVLLVQEQKVYLSDCLSLVHHHGLWALIWQMNTDHQLWRRQGAEEVSRHVPAHQRSNASPNQLSELWLRSASYHKTRRGSSFQHDSNKSLLYFDCLSQNVTEKKKQVELKEVHFTKPSPLILQHCPLLNHMHEWKTADSAAAGIRLEEDSVNL